MLMFLVYSRPLQYQVHAGDDSPRYRYEASLFSDVVVAISQHVAIP